MKKVRREIQVSFNSPEEKKERVYEDKFTEELSTLDEVKEKSGVVVWCKFTGCKYNQEVKGLQRTSGSLLKNYSYSPIAEQEAIWPNICTRDEIGINFDQVITASKNKIKVPSCFVASSKSTGRINFSSLLQSDGSALGGNIDSQHASDDGYGGLDPNGIYTQGEFKGRGIY